jgi:hypothetical protein
MCDLAAEGEAGQKTVILSAFGVGLTAMSVHMPLDFQAIVPLAFYSPEGSLL